VHAAESILPPYRSRADKDSSGDGYENNQLLVEELKGRLELYADEGKHRRDGPRDD
jgi:hypothetical protein